MMDLKRAKSVFVTLDDRQVGRATEIAVCKRSRENYGYGCKIDRPEGEGGRVESRPD